MAQPTLAELAAHFDPVDMPDITDLDTALRVINALCWQAERLKEPQPPIAGEYRIHLTPEHNKMLQELHANKRLAFEPEGESLDILDAFRELIEWAIEVEWDAWRKEQRDGPALAAPVVMSA
jgi:hypothetical protein